MKRSRSSSIAPTSTGYNSSASECSDEDNELYERRCVLPVEEELERLRGVREALEEIANGDAAAERGKMPHCADVLASLSNYESTPPLVFAASSFVQDNYPHPITPPSAPTFEGKGATESAEESSATGEVKTPSARPPRSSSPPDDANAVSVGDAGTPLPDIDAHAMRWLVREVLLPVVARAVEFATAVRGSPEEWLAKVNSRSLTIPAEDVYGILACAFCCVFDERDSRRVRRDSFTTINYSEMLAAPAGDCAVETVKLRLLLDYFWHQTGGRAEVAGAPAPPLEVSRGALSCRVDTLVRQRADIPLPALTMHALRESIEEQHEMARMDFANRWVGGGALSDGSVQEEIIFCQCPELNALRWLHRALDDAESLAVRGYRYHGRIAAGTYGSGLRYGARVDPPLTPGGALLVVDALDYRRYDEGESESSGGDGRRGLASQYRRRSIDREIGKLAGALRLPPAADACSVAGGNWGCGVFGGDYELKLLEQWVACALGGRQLHYFPFDVSECLAFADVAARMRAAGVTVGQLYHFLLGLESTPSHVSVWEALQAWLTTLEADD